MTEWIGEVLAGSPPAVSDDGGPRHLPSCAAADAAELHYRLRRLRGRYLGEDLFKDPAWDILLDLYVADFEAKKISITSACCAAGIPEPTGLRWIAKLVRRNLIRRYRDGGDGRRVNIEITTHGRNQMTELLDRFQGLQDTARRVSTKAGSDALHRPFVSK